MTRQPVLIGAALVGALILAAALYDAAGIVTRPFWPLFTWMLP